MNSKVAESSRYCMETLIARKPRELPFELLKQGLSFYVPMDAVKEKSLRAIVSTAGMRLNRTFKVIKLTEYHLFEVTVIIDKEGSYYDIFESSHIAKEMIGDKLSGKTKYPFEMLTEGNSFAVNINTGNEKSLRTACVVWGKRLNKKFTCIKHESHGIYEIACLHKNKPEFFASSPEALQKGV